MWEWYLFHCLHTYYLLQLIIISIIGRALLELQAQLPYGHTYCINKKDYNYAQSTKSDELLKVASHYNIPVLCPGNSDKQNPLLPVISTNAGVQNENFPYSKEAFNLIISQHALNDG